MKQLIYKFPAEINTSALNVNATKQKYTNQLVHLQTMAVIIVICCFKAEIISVKQKLDWN